MRFQFLQYLPSLPSPAFIIFWRQLSRNGFFPSLVRFVSSAPPFLSVFTSKGPPFFTSMPPLMWHT